MNRAARRIHLFDSAADYAAFDQIIHEAKVRTGMAIVVYCIMPTHWHFVLYPDEGRQMSRFMHWLTVTHAQRWQKFHQMVGTGPVYQGRFKAIPVQTDTQFLNVCRYVERNPLRAGLVLRAQDWQWSTLWQRNQDRAEITDDWPVGRPSNWTNIVNGIEDGKELETIRSAIKQSKPLGNEAWVRETEQALGISRNSRPRGRPKRAPGPLLQDHLPGA